MFVFLVGLFFLGFLQTIVLPCGYFTLTSSCICYSFLIISPFVDNFSSSGQYKNQQRNGFGTHTYSDGATWSGIWENDRYFSGHGVLRHASHEEQGTWENGKRTGHGKDVYPNGDVYSGPCEENGIMRVEYMLSHTTGSVYEGGVREMHRHGQGTLTFANGSRYTGGFRYNQYHGQGEWTDGQGTTYKGAYRHGEQHGYGELTQANGERYVGDYDEGQEHGYGEYTYKDGSTYVGEWRRGQQAGQGKHTDKAGRVMWEGEFVNGMCLLL